MSLTRRERVSQSQRAANRRNAGKSTGPRTEAGKRNVRDNALKHGFYSPRFRESLGRLGEVAGAFGALHARLRRSLAPRGGVQEELVADLARLWWKRDRLEAAQAAYLVAEQRRFERRQQLLRSQAEHRPVLFKECDHAGGLRSSDHWAGKLHVAIPALRALLAAAGRAEWRPQWRIALRVLYGKNPSWRGRMIIELYEALSPARASLREERPGGEANSERETEKRKFKNGKAKTEKADSKRDVGPGNTPGPDSTCAADSGTAWAYLRNLLELEIRDLAEECQLRNEEHPETSAAMCDSWLGPRPETEKVWTLYLRLESSIERQIDRKLRLLLKLREELPAPGRAEGCSGGPAPRRGSAAGAGTSRRIAAGAGRTVTRFRGRRLPRAAQKTRFEIEATRRKTRKMQKQSPQVIETRGRRASGATGAREREFSSRRRHFAAGASRPSGASGVSSGPGTQVRASTSRARASGALPAGVPGIARSKVSSRSPGKTPDPC